MADIYFHFKLYKEHMFCYNDLSFHHVFKTVSVKNMTGEIRETETRFIMNDYVYEFTRKRKRHMLFADVFTEA